MAQSTGKHRATLRPCKKCRWPARLRTHARAMAGSALAVTPKRDSKWQANSTNASSSSPIRFRINLQHPP